MTIGYMFDYPHNVVAIIDKGTSTLETNVGWGLRICERLITALAYNITTQKYLNFECENPGVVAILCDDHEKEFITNLLYKLPGETRFDRIRFINIDYALNDIKEEINELSPNYVFLVDRYSVKDELVYFIQNKKIPLFYSLVNSMESVKYFTSPEDTKKLYIKATQREKQIIIGINHNNKNVGNYHFDENSNLKSFQPGYLPTLDELDSMFYDILTKKVWDKYNLCYKVVSAPKFQNDIEWLLTHINLYKCCQSKSGVDRCLKVSSENGFIRKCYDRELIAENNSKQAVNNHRYGNCKFAWEYVLIHED